MITTHLKETIPGVVGNGTSASAFTVAYVTADILPWLHIASIIAGFVASVCTAIYYVREMRRRK